MAGASELVAMQQARPRDEVRLPLSDKWASLEHMDPPHCVRRHDGWTTPSSSACSTDSSAAPTPPPTRDDDAFRGQEEEEEEEEDEEIMTGKPLWSYTGPSTHEVGMAYGKPYCGRLGDAFLNDEYGDETHQGEPSCDCAGAPGDDEGEEEEEEEIMQGKPLWTYSGTSINEVLQSLEPRSSTWQ
mmetsp:Transcript_39005/g.112013  ORF Transcript_39005/g.112013 Transcript_39005/m.112013 type:complete len:185 (+) Transcript_39005:112-666(+)